MIEHIVPKFGEIGLVVPVPASKQRARQPVYEVAKAVAKHLKVESFEGIVNKLPTDGPTVSLKDLSTKDEKKSRHWKGDLSLRMPSPMKVAGMLWSLMIFTTAAHRWKPFARCLVLIVR